MKSSPRVSLPITFLIRSSDENAQVAFTVYELEIRLVPLPMITEVFTPCVKSRPIPLRQQQE
jgi:hypothetical protein